MDAPGNDLAPAALAIARVEYPSLDPGPYLATLDRMGEEAHARIGARLTLRRKRASARSTNTVRRAGVRRQPRTLRRPAKQLPERSARSPHRYPDQPRGHLPRGRATRRAASRRRQFPRSLPAPCGAGKHRGCRRRRWSSSTRFTAAHSCRRTIAASVAPARRRRRGIRYHVARSRYPPRHRRPYAVNLKRLYVECGRSPRPGSSRRCRSAWTHPQFPSYATAGCWPTTSRLRRRAARPRRVPAPGAEIVRNTASPTWSPSKATATTSRIRPGGRERRRRHPDREHVKTLRRRVAGFDFRHQLSALSSQTTDLRPQLPAHSLLPSARAKYSLRRPQASRNVGSAAAPYDRRR